MSPIICPRRCLALRVRDKYTDVSNPGDEEGEGLEEEEDEVMVFPEREVIAATEEEVGSDGELKQMNSA